MPQPSEALLRVAEACERIVHPPCLCGLPQCGECAKALEALATLEAHAAAIRAGRGTVTEDTI